MRGESSYVLHSVLHRQMGEIRYFTADSEIKKPQFSSFVMSETLLSDSVSWYLSISWNFCIPIVLWIQNHARNPITHIDPLCGWWWGTFTHFSLKKDKHKMDSRDFVVTIWHLLSKCICLLPIPLQAVKQFDNHCPLLILQSWLKWQRPDAQLTHRFFN